MVIENAKKLDFIFEKEHTSEESVLVEGKPEFDEFVEIWFDLIKNIKTL